MAALEERVAFLEGRVVEHSRSTGDIREAVTSLERRMDQRLAALEQRMDQRFAVLEQRVTVVDEKLGQQFFWVVGLQVTTFAAVVTAILVR